MPTTILITGANRGIGLEFVNQYAKEGYKILACCRNPDGASDLKQLATEHGNITIYKLDVTDLGQINKLSKSLKDTAIDILINNAGTAGERGQFIGQVDSENMQNVFKINTIAPTMIAQAFYKHIKNGTQKKIINITSRMGSIEDNTSGKSYAYRASKSALNSIMHSLQFDVKADGIKVLLLHPGWVKTDMGSQDADIDTDTSVRAMRKLIDKAHDLDRQFYHYSGSVLPW